MSTSRLSLYNNALIILGERPLVSEYENRAARKALDEVYGQDAVGSCLELAKPKFAQRTVKLATPTTSSVHGYDQVYTLPSDFQCLVIDRNGVADIFSDDVLLNRVDRFLLEGDDLATEIATNVYVRYITSNAPIGDWTSTFAMLVSTYLAKTAAVRINPSKVVEAEKAFKDQLGAVLEVEWPKEASPRPLKAIVTLDAFWTNVYNGALQLLGQPLITGNTDQSRARVAIDYVVRADFSGVFVCLEKVKPRFAMTTFALTGGTTSAQHGYTSVFTLPSDFLTIIDLHSDSALDTPLSRYFIDGGTIATNYTTAYLRYVQNDAATSLWSSGFLRYVCAYIANELKAEYAFGESGGERESVRANITRELQTRLEYALANEAVKEPEYRPNAPSFTLTDAWRVIYNIALSFLELDPILTNTDDSDRRKALDVTVNDNIAGTTLSEIIWNFACVREKLAYDATYTPTYGYSYRVAVPAAMHRIAQLSTDEYLYTPVEYTIEGGYIYSEHQELYVRYVTTAMLTTPGSWPQYFQDYIAAKMARRSTRLPGSNKQNVIDELERTKREAYATDAQRQPSLPQVRGSWNRARSGGGSWGIDNGRFRQR